MDNLYLHKKLPGLPGAESSVLTAGPPLVGGPFRFPAPFLGPPHGPPCSAGPLHHARSFRIVSQASSKGLVCTLPGRN